MKLVIKRIDGGFEVDAPEIPGSPYVGRARTMEGALGSWLHRNRDRVGVSIDLHPSAEPAEKRRRRRALKER